jgi:hypothetical protein
MPIKPSYLHFPAPTSEPRHKTDPLRTTVLFYPPVKTAFSGVKTGGKTPENMPLSCILPLLSCKTPKNKKSEPPASPVRIISLSLLPGCRNEGESNTLFYSGRDTKSPELHPFFRSIRNTVLYSPREKLPFSGVNIPFRNPENPLLSCILALLSWKTGKKGESGPIQGPE